MSTRSISIIFTFKNNQLDVRNTQTLWLNKEGLPHRADGLAININDVSGAFVTFYAWKGEIFKVKSVWEEAKVK